nr:hypothetical protein [Tanacetum cinerariifolium]
MDSVICTGNITNPIQFDENVEANHDTPDDNVKLELRFGTAGSGDPDREFPIAETFHEQTDYVLTKKEAKQIEADDQAIQITLMDLPDDIYAAVDSCETAQEIWLCVQQMMIGCSECSLEFGCLECWKSEWAYCCSEDFYSEYESARKGNVVAARAKENALVDKSQKRMHDAYMVRVDDLEYNEVFVVMRDKIVEKVVSTTDPVTTAGEVVTPASVEDTKPKVISTQRAKAIVFHEQVQAHIPPVSSSKDKGKAKMIEPEKPLKKKDQIALDEEVARKLEAKMRAEIEEEERVAIEKDKANKVVIEECDDVHATNDANRQLEHDKVADDDTAELKRCLEIVPEDDDDVAIEATPLSSKSPTIVDYRIYREEKRSYFKIIRAYGNSQNYLTFGTIFNNFNKEDLDVLRGIVKERFKKTKPVDDMENLLFQTLKTMFEPHVEDIIWKYQQAAVKVNNWRLFDSCGVYYVTTKTMVYYLLVEKMYPFTNNVLHQLFSDVRLQVDYEGKIVRFKGLHGVTTAQLVLLVYKVAAFFNKDNAAKSRVTTTVRVSTARWIKWVKDQDMRVNKIYYEMICIDG